MKNPREGFNSKKYIRNQTSKIKQMVMKNHDKLYIEFGGKIIQDKHSARVLPGYNEDAKLKILKNICKNSEIIFVVSAKDIKRGRIRGDFRTTYDDESVRIIKELKDRGIEIKNLAVSLLDQKRSIPPVVKNFEKRISRMGIKVFEFFSLKRYPSRDFNFKTLEINPFVRTNKKIVAIISPGGGSGKFGICLNQLYYEMKNGVTPNYLKFETFPVHNLPVDHPINLAYMAASADFYDIVMADKRHKNASSYNRDLENYELLNLLAKIFKKQGVYLRKISSATNMGANMISTGIENDEIIQKESAAEIARRLIRYKFEVREKKEDKKVLERVREILKML